MANGFLESRPSVRTGTDTFGWPVDLAGTVIAQKFPAPSSGTLNISEIGAWLNNSGGGGQFRLAIFTHDAANDCPETMISGSETGTLTVTGSAVQIIYAAITCTVTGGSTYWLLGFGNGGAAWDQAASGGINKYLRDQTAYTWPTGDIWHSEDGGGTEVAGFYVIYADGEPPAGTVIPVLMNQYCQRRN